jgi:hypothetical protein
MRNGSFVEGRILAFGTKKGHTREDIMASETCGQTLALARGFARAFLDDTQLYQEKLWGLIGRASFALGGILSNWKSGRFGF